MHPKEKCEPPLGLNRKKKHERESCLRFRVRFLVGTGPVGLGFKTVRVPSSQFFSSNIYEQPVGGTDLFGLR